MGDYFGYGIDMSLNGNTIVVSAPCSSIASPDSGVVQVFHFEVGAGRWAQIGQTIRGPLEDIQFGRDVAISANGSVVALGHSTATVDGISYAGRVSIFEYNGSASSWVQLGSNIVGSETSQETGWSVALSSDGTVLACGELNAKGQVRVFGYNQNANKWQQIGQTLQGNAQDDLFGLDIDLSDDGTVLAVATSTNLPSDVCVFEYSYHDNAWTQRGQALAIDNEEDEGFEQHGIAVSLSADGRTVAAGSHQNDNVAMSAGHVRIFEYGANNNTWNQLGQDLEGEFFEDLFGAAVALSSSGRIIAVGVSSGWHEGFANAGYVSVFQYNDTLQGWSQVGSKLYGNQGNGRFGSRVAISGDGRTVAGST